MTHSLEPVVAMLTGEDADGDWDVDDSEAAQRSDSTSDAPESSPNYEVTVTAEHDMYDPRNGGSMTNQATFPVDGYKRLDEGLFLDLCDEDYTVTILWDAIEVFTVEEA